MLGGLSTYRAQLDFSWLIPLTVRVSYSNMTDGELLSLCYSTNVSLSRSLGRLKHYAELSSGETRVAKKIQSQQRIHENFRQISFLFDGSPNLLTTAAAGLLFSVGRKRRMSRLTESLAKGAEKTASLTAELSLDSWPNSLDIKKIADHNPVEFYFERVDIDGLRSEIDQAIDVCIDHATDARDLTEAVQGRLKSGTLGSLPQATRSMTFAELNDVADAFHEVAESLRFAFKGKSLQTRAADSKPLLLKAEICRRRVSDALQSESGGDGLSQRLIKFLPEDLLPLADEYFDSVVRLAKDLQGSTHDYVKPEYRWIGSFLDRIAYDFGQPTIADLDTFVVKSRNFVAELTVDPVPKMIPRGATFKGQTFELG